MKNSKMKLMDEAKRSMVKVVGDVAMKVGETAVDTKCTGWVYEPKVPQELLNDKLIVMKGIVKENT